MTAGVTAATSNRFDYDSNDIFRVAGVQVTLAQFKSTVTASRTGTGDTVSINYNPDPAGISEFNICRNAGAVAPIDLSDATGNFDTGTSANDVRLTFTAPSTNATTSYTIQRQSITTAGVGVTAGYNNGSTTCTNGTAGNTTDTNTDNNLGNAFATSSDSAGIPAGSGFITVGAISVDAGKTGTFTNFDLADGVYCYRVRTQDPTTGTPSFSNYDVVTLPGITDSSRPTSTSTVLTSSGGFAATLDTGDKVEITFSEDMSVASNAVIRVTDRDALAGGGSTSTVADIICNTNATCTLSTDKRVLTVTLTGNPQIVAAGSVAGVQLPADITDSSGINDLSGNTWDIPLSADKTIP